MKKCKDCGIEKEQSEFYPTQGECKECSKKRIKKNYYKNIEYYHDYDKYRQRHSFNRIFKHRYSLIKQRIEGRATRHYKIEGKEILPYKEFLDWCYKEENLKCFEKLYDIWKKNIFCRRLTPSIDRIDNNKSYTINNIRWITQSNNSIKYNKPINIK